jgi:hypothetical protein
MRDDAMTNRNRAALLTGTIATALCLLATPYSANANSRRHVFKPGDASANVTRDVGDGAPEIDPASIGLGIGLVAGVVAIALAGRRQPPQ